MLASAARAAAPRVALRPAAALTLRPWPMTPPPGCPASSRPVAVPRPRVTLTPASQAGHPFPPLMPTTWPAIRGPVAVPRPPIQPAGGARPAVPTAPLPLGVTILPGVQRLLGSADNWKDQMVRSVLDACRLCCPEEYAPLKNISTQETDTWLNLLCRFPAEYNLSFIPSPEEMTIIVRSQESWADVVRYDLTLIEFHVVSDSTLVWSKKNRAGFLKSCKWAASFTVQSGAQAPDFIRMLADIPKKEVCR